MNKNNDIQMNQNELVQYLKKPAKDFTREDIIRFIEAKGISMLNFRYVADDGKLKSYDDGGLSEKLYNKNEEISKLVRQFLHCG